MAYTRLQREMHEPPEDDRWSDWQNVMIPALGEDDDFKPRGRGHDGYRRRHIRDVFSAYEGSCGIYEWKAERADQPSKVVYVGSTCRSTDTSLMDRISEYCRNGSHKIALINGALTWGYELWVRVKPTEVNAKAAAAEAENALLAQYDYAWNSTNNAAVRSILMPHGRPLRETREPPCEWSHWEVAMIPQPHENFRERKDNVGYRRKGIGNDLIPDECLIYEWQARRAGQTDRVVYVGSTCQKKNESLVDRIREEYCIEGSWKRDLINDALNRGYELWFRYILAETRGVACAEDHENSLLAQFDYAWNTRNILP